MLRTYAISRRISRTTFIGKLSDQDEIEALPAVRTLRHKPILRYLTVPWNMRSYRMKKPGQGLRARSGWVQSGCAAEPGNVNEAGDAGACD